VQLVQLPVVRLALVQGPLPVLVQLLGQLAVVHLVQV